uniref:Uncharacterized protein n=1 Tax=Tanacetum cinerariifolium TaxID=118510 RepID=A0A6L2N2G3_TANCI|nr:hypothetical protein [Tanacetum cinerariifolium]
MDTTIDQQVAMDEALVPTAQRLKIGRSNFRLLSDIKSKESTLQLVYDVLCICPFFKAFLVTSDVDILHICPRVHGQSFAEPPFKEEILAFIRFLGHIVAIRTLTDVNINKLYQPWRSFAAIINKCLTEKSSGYDSLRLSQAQILWGLYHKRNVDYAYLMWEDFVYQVEHKNQKKSNEMYYPQFTKAIIHHFMLKDPSITWRNKFGALLPIELTNAKIKNYKAYKECYAIATGEEDPKPKASVKRTKSSSDTSITPPTAAASLRLTASVKGKQTAKASKAKSLSALSEVAMTEAQQLKLVTKRSMQQTHISQPSGSGADEGTCSKPGVPDVSTNESEEEFFWNYTDDKGDVNEEKDDDSDEEDEGDDGKEGNGDDDDADQEVVRDDDKDDEEEGGDDEHEFDEDKSDKETRDKESFDPIPQTLKNIKDDVMVKRILVSILGRGLQATVDVEDSHVTLASVNPDGMKSIFETTSQLDVPTPTSVAPLPITVPIMTPSTIATITTTSQAQILPTTRMNEAVKVAVQIKSDRLHDETQRENNEFLRTVDKNMKKIIKEQVKEQVKVQVSKILPRIEQAVNEQLKAEVLTRSSHSLSEMELKKILIEKMEGNKSIQRSDEQRNLCKALVKAYESNKIILDTYRETVSLKRCRDDDADKDEEPSAGPDQGSKRHREGKEPESASATTETATRSAGRSTQGSRSRKTSALAEEPMQTTSQMAEPFHPEFDTELLAGPTYELMKGSCKGLIELEYQLEEVYKAITDQLEWVNPKGQQYLHNLLQPLPLIPDNRGRRVIPFKHFINNDLEYLRGGASSRKYTTSITKTKAADYEHIKWIEDLMPRTISIVIQRRMEDLQLGVESYQKKLNLTKPDTYQSDLKCKEAYTAYSNPRGFIYQNKDKKNRLMRIDELHKFSDGTLTDVRTTLDDRLKGIRMRYLPQTIWMKSDKDRAAAMIQAIDKRLKTRKIMRSLDRFVGGRIENIGIVPTEMELILEHTQQAMSFKNFIYTKDDEDLTFLPKDFSPGFNIRSLFVSINTGPVKADEEPTVEPTTEPVNERVRNIVDLRGVPKEILFFTLGVLRPALGRGISKQWEASAINNDTPMPSIFNNDEGLEDCLEFKDVTSCHLKISAITPLGWKGVLDNHLDVDLLDLHDCCYARQATVYNVVNRRSRKLLEVIEKLRGEENVMRARELSRKEEYEGLQAKCEAAMTDFDKNPAILFLREKMSLLADEAKEHKGNLDRLMLETEKANLEAIEPLLHQEIEKVKHDRREVVSKVVPYAYMELLYSDELGTLVRKLVSLAITFGRCRAYELVARMKEPFDLLKVKGYHLSYEKEHTHANNDLATATFSWLNEYVADAFAFMEDLLLKKPSTLQKPVHLRTQMYVPSSQLATISFAHAS